ncbi:MAG: deoxyhypusine synthase family protein [Nanoarchaeota archaeon]
MEKIKAFRYRKNISVNDFVRELDGLGFQARKLGQAIDVIESMIKDKDCKVFLGVAGALVPGGMKEILVDMITSGWIDVLVITGANLTHDLIEDFGFNHLIGHESMDDYKLNKKGLVRMYNTLMPNKAYEKLEEFFKKNWEEISKQESIKDFLWAIGKLSPGNGILKACYNKKIPIFCPAISDSGIGLMMWSQLAQGKKAELKALEDLKEILDIAWTAKRTGVIYLGGGTPKNYIQQAMQFSKEANYGVQITMDRAEFGGSSGAELKEGISWGKLSRKAKNINLACDITIALPLIYTALKQRI